MKPNEAQQVQADILAKLRKIALPVTPETGFVTDFENQCILVKARHPLHVEPTVIRIPVSLLLLGAASVVMTTIGPMIAKMEQTPPVPAKPEKVQ